MKIHYISDHSILEYDEVQLLLDLGHEVFSNGAYLDPAGHITHPRPGLRGGIYYEQWADLARVSPRTNLPVELLDPFDVIIVMHSPNVVIQNWDKLKGRNVIWRSIGQSLPNIERKLAQLKAEGLKIVRYSPKERNLDDYCGEDALIRFYKDESVYKGWTGNTQPPSIGRTGTRVVNFSQSLKGRRDFCHYDEIMPVIEAFNGTVFGPGNEDLGEYNGGQVPFDKQIEIMQNAGAMVYGGTWPAPYTLSFIEALMLGLPIVAPSKAIAHLSNYQAVDFYEVDELLGEISGIVCDTVDQMIVETRRLIEDPAHAANISSRQRELALKYFSKEQISQQWQELLKGL